MVLDLSDATFLDSMALGVILAAKKRQTAAQGRLDLVVATPELRRIFEITMLDEVFDIHETRADAIGSPGGSRARERRRATDERRSASPPP